jgi:flagellar biosynthesis chaperone FliJ
MTVKRGTSAMVSIVQGKASGEVVYLYDPESSAGSDRFAFKSVRFRNPTGSTLESGPVTVYGEGRFIGEGLTEAIPPRALAVVPFALDRQVVVDSSGSTGDRIARLVKLHRGVLTAEVQHLRNTKLKVVNRLGTPATVLIRHTVHKGWTLLRAPKTGERFGEAHLFEVRLGAGSHAVVEIEEATPMVRVLDLRSPVGLDLVRVYLQTPRVEPEFAAAMAKLLKLHTEMTKHEEAIENLRQQGDEYRQRNDELHAQIFSLKAVKAKGTLMQHLETKMKEISQRLQANTIAIVDHQEKVMVAKVRFHEGLAELTLEKKTEPSGDKSKKKAT